MPIDFQAMVLGPCMDTFARPVTVTPVKSQPLVAQYDSRGIWEVTAIDIVTEDGGSMQSRNIKLGIQFNDYTIIPAQGDIIESKASDIPLAYWQGYVDPNSSIEFLVDDQRPDGQGGAYLILKRKKVGNNS